MMCYIHRGCNVVYIALTGLHINRCYVCSYDYILHHSYIIFVSHHYM